MECVEAVPCLYCDAILSSPDTLKQHIKANHEHEDHTRFDKYLDFRESKRKKFTTECSEADHSSALQPEDKVDKESCVATNIYTASSTNFGSFVTVKEEVDTSVVGVSATTVEVKTEKDISDEHQSLVNSRNGDAPDQLMLEILKSDPCGSDSKFNSGGAFPSSKKVSDNSASRNVVDEEDGTIVYPQCRICSKQFRAVHYLELHFQRKHPGESITKAEVDRDSFEFGASTGVEDSSGAVASSKRSFSAGEQPIRTRSTSRPTRRSKEFHSTTCVDEGMEASYVCENDDEDAADDDDDWHLLDELVGKKFRRCPICKAKFSRSFGAVDLRKHFSLKGHKSFTVYTKTGAAYVAIENINVGEPRDNSMIWLSGVSMKEPVLTCSMCTFQTKSGADSLSKLRALRRHCAIRHSGVRVMRCPESMLWFQEDKPGVSNLLPRSEDGSAETSGMVFSRRDGVGCQRDLPFPHVLVNDVMKDFVTLPEHFRPNFSTRGQDGFYTIEYKCPVCSETACSPADYMLHIKHHLTWPGTTGSVSSVHNDGTFTNGLESPDPASRKFCSTCGQFNRETLTVPLVLHEQTRCTVCIKNILKRQTCCVDDCLVDGIGLFSLLVPTSDKIPRIFCLPLTKTSIKQEASSSFVVEVSGRWLETVALAVGFDREADIFLLKGRILEQEKTLPLFEGQIVASLVRSELQRVYDGSSHNLRYAIGRVVDEYWCKCRDDAPTLPAECELDLTLLQSSHSSSRPMMNWVFETNCESFIPPSNKILALSVSEYQIASEKLSTNVIMSAKCGTVFENVHVTICKNQLQYEDLHKKMRIERPLHEQVFMIYKKNDHDVVFSTPEILTDCTCPNKCLFLKRSKLLEFLRRLGVKSGDSVTICIGRLFVDTTGSSNDANCSVRSAIFTKAGSCGKKDDGGPITDFDACCGLNTDAESQPLEDQSERVAFRRVTGKKSGLCYYRCEECSFRHRSIVTMKYHFKIKHQPGSLVGNGSSWRISRRPYRINSRRVKTLQSWARTTIAGHRPVTAKSSIDGEEEMRAIPRQGDNSSRIVADVVARMVQWPIAAERIASSDLYTCQLCSLKLMKNGVMNHFRRYHPDLHIRLNPGGRKFCVVKSGWRFECSICGQKYDQRGQFERHYHSHETAPLFDKSRSYEYTISNPGRSPSCEKNPGVATLRSRGSETNTLSNSNRSHPELVASLSRRSGSVTKAISSRRINVKLERSGVGNCKRRQGQSMKERGNRQIGLKHNSCSVCVVGFGSRLCLLNHMYHSHRALYLQKIESAAGVSLANNDNNSSTSRGGGNENLAFESEETLAIEQSESGVHDHGDVDGESEAAEMKPVVYDISHCLVYPSNSVQSKMGRLSCYSLSSDLKNNCLKGKIALRLLPVACVDIPQNVHDPNKLDSLSPDEAVTCTWCGSQYLDCARRNMPRCAHMVSRNDYQTEKLMSIESPWCFCGKPPSAAARVESFKYSDLVEHCRKVHHGLHIAGFYKCTKCEADGFPSIIMREFHMSVEHPPESRKQDSKRFQVKSYRSPGLYDERIKMWHSRGDCYMDLEISSCEDWSVENFNVEIKQPALDTAPRKRAFDTVVDQTFPGLVKIDSSELFSSHCEICGSLASDSHRYLKHANQFLPRVWSCASCSGLFATVSSFLMHKPCRNRERTTGCSACSAVIANGMKHGFRHHNKRPGHLATNHSPRAVKFPAYIYIGRINAIERVHEGQSRCRYCPRFFSSETEIQEHSICHEVGPSGKRQKYGQHECKFCYVVLCTEASLQFHESLHSSLKCPFCGCRFVDVESVEKHVFSNHLVTALPKIHQECGFCGLSQRGCVYSTHMFAKKCDYQHPIAKKCRRCHASFSKQSELARHLFTVHREPVRTQCTRCRVWFPSRYMLMRHRKLYCLKAARLRFGCYCGCRFGSKVKLLFHRAKCHSLVRLLTQGSDGSSEKTVAKSFICETVSCGRNFKYRSQLALHRRLSHHKALVCPECKLHFGSEAKLRNHHRLYHAQLYIQCHHCQVQLRSHRSRRRHVMNMHRHYYSCKPCKKSFEFFQDFEYHRENTECPEGEDSFRAMFSIDRILECTVCGLIFPKDGFHALESHWNQHTELGSPAVSKCPHCVFTTADSHSDVYRHMTDYHPDKFHRCTSCGMDFTHLETLQFHRNYCSLIGVAQRKFMKRLKSLRSCDECHLVFIDNMKAGMHTASAHDVDETVSVACPVCKAPQKNPPALVYHISKSHKTCLVCPKCGEGFQDTSPAKLHLLGAHGHAAFEINCDYCDMTCDGQVQMEIHLMRKHRDKLESGGNTSFISLCQVCGGEFHSTRIAAHVNSSHLTERKFQCKVCDASFKMRHHLQNHEKTHQARQFTCGSCDMKFRLKHHLESHERSYHGRSGYKCNECGKEFKLRWKRTHHRRECHGVDDDDEQEDEDDGRRLKNRRR